MNTKEDNGNMRSFDTGATRDTAEGKLDMEGFTHPMVMKQFAKYMNMNRLQSDGQLRDSDNWQKGIPIEAYVKSLKRHTDDVWLEHRTFKTPTGIIASLCGVMFNSMGMLHEVLKDCDWKLQDFDGDEPTPEMKKRMDRIKFLEVTAYPHEIDFLDTDVPENIDTLQDAQDETELTFCGNEDVAENCEGCNVGKNECKFSGQEFTMSDPVIAVTCPAEIEVDAREYAREGFRKITEDMMAPIVAALEEWNENLEEVPEVPVCFGKCASPAESCLDCKDKSECDELPMCWECEFRNECAGDFERVEDNPFMVGVAPQVTPEPEKPDYGTHNCLTCVSVDKKWPDWPCCECLNNQLTHDTEKTHDFYSPQGYGLV
jgi:hypothetical protein